MADCTNTKTAVPGPDTTAGPSLNEQGLPSANPTFPQGTNPSGWPNSCGQPGLSERDCAELVNDYNQQFYNPPPGTCAQDTMGIVHCTPAKNPPSPSLSSPPAPSPAPPPLPYDGSISFGAYTGARRRVVASTVPPPTAPLAEQPQPDRTGNLRVGGECGVATACAVGFTPPGNGMNGVNDRFLGT